jgi:carbonic anhydrase/acetyltransferase-like protein (isoleucine patch superfamily)
MEPLQLPSPVVDPAAFVAPGVHLYGNVNVAAHAVLMFGTVARAELDRIEIGGETNIQDNSVLHADEGLPCVIGRRVTVGHIAVVHGATVGDQCLVGIGARLLNGSSLGEGAWLAAGSLLTEGTTIPPWTLAVGVPARPLRELTAEEIARQDEGVDHYLRFANTYRAMGLGAERAT